MSTPLTVTRIGHACQLIEIGETRILTDPWFTQTATYYQGEPVTPPAAGLGPIDAVVVSHEHYDHCDLDALTAAGFDPGVPLIGPGTVAAIARDKGFRDVRAIEAWDATSVAGVTVTAGPGPARRPRGHLRDPGRETRRLLRRRLAARPGAGHHPGQVRLR
jgi:L-ascorbate metabolism protein UlaG (beta-lactamase superfamily)